MTATKTTDKPIAVPPIERTAPDVYRAIADVTRALSKSGIAKNKSNEQQHYKFRGIDDIYNALSDVLAGAELCILPRMANRTQEERQTAKGGVLFYVTVEANFDFVSARDGSSHTVTMYGEAMDSGDKATNKAMSAAYKYACLQVFCIPTEGMVEDADSQTHDVKPNPPKEDTQLLATIRQTLNDIGHEFSKAGHPAQFFETLGGLGYETVMDVPANRELAREVVKTLKLRLADLTAKK